MTEFVRHRAAVGGMFFANGLLMGSWAPQIPLFLARLEISETTLGLLILLFGLGALVAMPVAGYLIHRHGSRAVLRIAAVACGFALLPVVAAPDVALATVAMLAFGALIGGMDVAMNANAVAVETRHGRAIMSSSHGFWSLGGFAGGATGGLLIERLGALGHAGIVTAIMLAVVVALMGWLAADAGKATEADAKPYRLPREPLVFVIGLVALASMVPEGAVLDWSALYLRQELGGDMAAAGFAYAGFSATMAIMRFAGDAVRDRFGPVLTLRVSACIAGVGMLVAGLAPSGPLAIAAFAFCGLGTANLVPIAFSAGGAHPSGGAALSTVTFMGYAGILAAPSLIGVAAEHSSFSTVFVVLAFVLFGVALLGNAVAGARREAA